MSCSSFSYIQYFSKFSFSQFSSRTHSHTHTHTRTLTRETFHTFFFFFVYSFPKFENMFFPLLALYQSFYFYHFEQRHPFTTKIVSACCKNFCTKKAVHNFTVVPMSREAPLAFMAKGRSKKKSSSGVGLRII